MSKKKNRKTPETVESSEAVETPTAVAETSEATAETANAAAEPSEATPEPSDAIAEAPEAIEEISIEAVTATEPLSDTGSQLSQIIEAILFASQKPVSAKELSAIFKGAADAEKENLELSAFAKVKEAQLRAAIEELENTCLDPAKAYEVRENAAGWQLVTKPHFAPWLRQLFPENRAARLSAPAMETLAIIAYRQPITRADIEAVRGVAVDGVMQTILDRGLVKIAGRSEQPGRPLLYETTQFFMEHFGLKDLDDLPNATELRKINLPQAPVPEVPAEENKEELAPLAEEPAPAVEESTPIAEAAAPVATEEAAPAVEEVIAAAEEEEAKS